MAKQQLGSDVGQSDMSAAGIDSLPTFGDAFIKAWPNGGQAQLTPLFLTLQQHHIAHITQPATLPAPSAFTALLHSLLSSVLPPSPAAWVGTVASFLSEVLDRSTRSAASATGSIAQTALVDGLWLICQPHSTCRQAPLIGVVCSERATDIWRGVLRSFCRRVTAGR